MTILTADQVSFLLDGRALLDSISLSFHESELTAIIGPNGAGKSTLTRLLSGESKPSLGSILFRGQDIRSFPPWRLACMRAVMPQASHLVFPFSAFEVAALGAEGIGCGLDERKRRDIVMTSLEQADVAHLRNRSYQTLSGGEKQRVHFARVLAQLAAGHTVEEQQVLFLDEPIASLDLKHQLQLLRQVRQLVDRGMTVIAVLHDLQLAADIADKVLMLSHGRTASYGAPDEVLTRQRIESVFEIGLASSRLPHSPWTSLPSGFQG